MNLISEYVAPWALPREDIPLHMVWEKEFAYDIIKVTMPSDLIVKEFFNVEKFTEEATLTQLIYLISRLKTINFFSLTMHKKRRRL